MKTSPLITFSSVALAFGLLAGCEKKSETPVTPTKETQKTATDAGAALQKTASDVSAEVKKTVTDTTKQAESATAAATAKTQEYIDKARALVADKKYQDALGSLQQLSGLTLSADQQKMVDDLKKTIQTALGDKAATDAASAAGNLLKK